MFKYSLIRFVGMTVTIASLAFISCVDDSNGGGEVIQSGCPYPNNPADGMYQIISPNGGETCIVGEECEVKILAKTNGSAYVDVYIRGKALSPIEGRAAMDSKNGVMTSKKFIIPEYLTVFNPAKNDFDSTYSVTDSALIIVTDYGNTQFADTSNCYFKIKKN